MEEFNKLEIKDLEKDLGLRPRSFGAELKYLVDDLNKLNNTLTSYNLSTKEIKDYIRSKLRNEAKKIKKEYYNEFNHISDSNILKQEIHILLVKLGIIRNIKVPNIKQLENKEDIIYSDDELSS